MPMAVVIASLLDKYFNDGRYIDSALAILRRMRHSFGI